MSKKNHSHILFILDRSGSMATVQQSTVEGFNEFIEGQKSVAGTADISLVLFDHEYITEFENTNITMIPALSVDRYQPRGSTALFDAICRGIDDLGHYLSKLPEKERAENVIVVILTDGMENASTRYSFEDVKQRIAHQSEHYNWNFLFLSSDLESIQTAHDLNIKTDYVHSFDHTDEGMQCVYRCASIMVNETRGNYYGTKKLKNC